MEIFQNAKKSAAELCQILGMVIIDNHLAGYARGYILPVCIVPLGMMLLVSTFIIFHEIHVKEKFQKSIL